MARNWLRSAMLPRKYWYHALKRACKVCNMLPLKQVDKITSPHELVYGQKLDYRNMLPMFSIAYINLPKDTSEGGKWRPQLLQCILMGKSHKSNAYLYYHPPTKQLISSAETVKYDLTRPAGPAFNEPYNHQFSINTQSSMEFLHKPPTHESINIVYRITSSNQYIKSRILHAPINDDNNHYTVQDCNSGDIHEVPTEEISTTKPTELNHHQDTDPFPDIPWLKTDAKITVIIPAFQYQPKQGYLKFNSATGEWSFSPGRKGTLQPIPLPNFHELAPSMIDNKKIFKGWKSSRVALSARQVQATSNIMSHLIIARKVSAAHLKKQQPPTSLTSHKLMEQSDKDNWDASYKEEYDGLVNINTWTVITEAEYQENREKYGRKMPTMAIAVIKRDRQGRPDCAKYRIVALDNLDSHKWSRANCYAPVMSQQELRFIVALAAKKKCVPKTGDIKQAFCQSQLPEGENYICTPPPGCILSKPNTLWKLNKTLYGLK